jgi:hypothetical protein
VLACTSYIVIIVILVHECDVTKFYEGDILEINNWTFDNICNGWDFIWIIIRVQ